MASVNKVTLIGNLTRDPDVAHLSDVKVANFTVATTDKWKDKQSGEWKEKSEFTRVVAWRWLAETAEKFLVKGKQVYVEGKLETRKYTDKEGQERSITEVIAKEIVLLGKRDDAPEAKVTTVEDTDLPF